MGGGSLKDCFLGGLKGMAWGAGTGAVTGGLFEGAREFFRGNNVWSGEAIAEGRNAFSFKNTPVINSPAPLSEPIPVGNANTSQSSGNIQPSENVQKALDNMNKLKQEGAVIHPNKLDPTQELNMTIEYKGENLNLRMETHPISIRYGGAGPNIPIRHFNIELIPKPHPPLPNGGHIILPTK